ncbi:ATP-binding protein [Nonomuraea sp. KM90]|uniref:ATP-binding protein n=1 Tax=Nonomuraea sp. KM90 TaxID=3457428 RepID=UPI003FCCEAB2
MSASWTLAPCAVSVPVARRLTRATLRDWGVPDEPADLLVSELVTNAVQHAGGPVRLRLSAADGVLRCEVGDGGPGLPRPRPATPDDEGSRGLALVAALASAWGSTRTRRGKVVWFELPAPVSRSSSGLDSGLLPPVRLVAVPG